MKQIVVDANVLVSFLTDRNLRQQEQAGELFRQAARGELALIIHQLVVAELVYVLLNLYSVPAEEVAATLDELFSLPGAQTVDAISWASVLEMWPRTIPSFADAALATLLKNGRYDGIATFDEKFGKQLKRNGLPSFW